MFVQWNAPLAEGQNHLQKRIGLLRGMRFGGHLAHLGAGWLRTGHCGCSETPLGSGQLWRGRFGGRQACIGADQPSGHP